VTATDDDRVERARAVSGDPLGGRCGCRRRLDRATLHDRTI